MQRQALCAAIVLATTTIRVALAHHSTAPYDLIHGTTIEGQVTRFAWENPHAHIFMDVRADGGTREHWTVEIDSPGVLRRLGWTKDTLKAGDRVRVSGARAKDGSFNLKALTIQLADGRKLFAVPKVEN
jgi:Family of unknown function (DUF6152)